GKKNGRSIFAFILAASRLHSNPPPEGGTHNRRLKAELRTFMENFSQPFHLQRMVHLVAHLIKRGATQSYVGLLQKHRPAEISQVLMHLKPREREEVFQQLYQQDLGLAATIVSEMVAADHGHDLLELLTNEELSELLQTLPPDDTAYLLTQLPDDRYEEVLALMELERSIVAQELLQYPENTAGRIMTPDVFCLSEDLTVAQAVTELQQSSDRLEMVFYLYVVDSRKHLVGVVALRQLLLSPPNTPLKQLMTTDVIKCTVEDDQEEVARTVAQFNIVAVPVVDADNKLVGIVTVDDVIDVLREEANEDLFAIAGVESDDRALTQPMYSLQRRLPWLLLSMGTALISAFVVSRFQTLLSFKPDLALAAMLPVFATVGGNATTQTLTVTVRSLSLGEVSPETSLRVLLKELAVGLGNGLCFGILLAIIVGIWQHNLYFAVVVGIATLFNLVVAATTGAMSPLILKRLGVDPALASSVFAITLTDALGFLSYLGLAWWLLRG
ncbi:MAG: magnesium transporter, partial [Blastocatellia bacterium]|nr:magnesium transporter [Blastocatellia bacterium]